MRVEIKRPKIFKGNYVPPPDKSISHRAAILLSLAKGTSVVTNFLKSEDTLATVKCLKKLGVELKIEGSNLIVKSDGMYCLKEPDDVLDAMNSATSMRLLSGVLSTRPFFSVITGDKYLRRRPMKRIIEPLTSMGATIFSRQGGFAPLAIYGGKLTGITYHTKVASAQVKSTILIAGLGAEGVTTVIEPATSRDHTERMLNFLGCPLKIDGNAISVEGGKVLTSRNIEVPGDISSAAFFMVAAAILPGSEIYIRNVGLNPTRTGIIEVLKRAGADVQLKNVEEKSGEPSGDVIIRGGRELSSFTIDGDEVPLMIDEIPVIAVLATQAKGKTIIRGARELRFKESDRLRAISENLTKMGAKVEEFSEGLEITGPVSLQGAVVNAYGDHRIAMSLSIAGLVASGTTIIEGAEAVSVSYPGFFKDINSLAQV